MTPLHGSGRAPTLVGRVRHVMGATVTIELLADLAGSTPLHAGRVYHIGQIGSLVCVPQGPITLIAAVTMIGISELAVPPPPAQIPQQGDRWLTAQLLGEFDSSRRFQRGVSTFPSIDDDVHFATSDELSAIYPKAGGSSVPIGRLSTSRNDTFRLDLGKLVTRHAAVVGSTGSGKSSTVARLVQSVLREGFGRANIVIVDPHGEYARAFGDSASVRRAGSSGSDGLSVPYWALGLDDLLSAYLGTRTPAAVHVRSKLQELVVAARRKFVKDAGWPSPSPDDITVDTPIPYDLRDVWHALDFDNRATVRSRTKTSTDWAVIKPGVAATLTPTKFEPYGPGGEPPTKCTTHGYYSPLPDRMRARLQDPLFRFLARSFPVPANGDPLPQRLSEWLGGNRPISILDFAGVPSEASDVAIGAILTLLFDVAVACPPDVGIGRNRPVWIVLEEAHRFVGSKVRPSAGAACAAAERIAREGRKYGVGLLLVSQRPSELSDTALSQSGSIISMRLSNTGDQNSVKSALPDTVANLADALPALRTGEALVTGEATTLPARVLVELPSPMPDAQDPPIEAWRGESTENDTRAAVARWRGVAETAEDQPKETS